jgi:integrase
MTRSWPKGVTRTPKGWRIRLGPGGSLLRKRYPPSTPLETVVADLEKFRKTLKAGTSTEPLGTLAGDVARYLRDYMHGRPGHDERARHLDLWIAALGPDTWRTAITRDDIARVLNQWKASGLAADTCNKRRTALLALYHALDGKGASNPVRELPKFRPPDPLPRGIAYHLIEKALAKLPRCKTRARLAVMAYTGLRQGQIMALKPDAWDTRRKLLLVPGTGKGRGTKPYVLPLSDRATEALTLLDELDAWGRFTWAPMARMWKKAATAAKLPEGTVPYDLRHSFGTAIYRKTGDLKATKELLGHSSLRMTERYMLAAVPQRQQRAIAAAFPKRGKLKTGRRRRK